MFLVPAAVAHLFAALAASGLAAHDSYATAAAGYALGSVLGLALILWRIDEDGIVACAWGTLLNGAVALAVPLVALVLRAEWGRRAAAARAGRGWPSWRARPSLAIVLQAFFVVCLRFASGLGTGAVTSFTYAYFVAAALVSVTATSLGVVSSVPLTRAALSPARASRHVDQHVARLVRRPSPLRPACSRSSATTSSHAALGPAYEGEAGSEIGRLIVLLGPWMAASIGVTITFPMLFVAGRERRLPLLAGVAIAVHIVVAFAGGQSLRARRRGAGADDLDRARARVAAAAALAAGPACGRARPPARRGRHRRARAARLRRGRRRSPRRARGRGRGVGFCAMLRRRAGARPPAGLGLPADARLDCRPCCATS